MIGSQRVILGLSLISLSCLFVCMHLLMHMARGLHMWCNSNSQEDWIEIKEPMVLFPSMRMWGYVEEVDDGHRYTRV